MVNTQQAASTEKVAHSSGIFVALIPWVLFTVVAEHRTLKLASIAALVLAAVISPSGHPRRPAESAGARRSGGVRGLHRDRFRSATLRSAEFVERYARAIAAALLALIAIRIAGDGALHRAVRARESAEGALVLADVQVGQPAADADVGGVFAAMVPFHIAAGAIDTRPTNIVLNWIVPIGLVLVGVKQTSAITKGEEA